MERDPMAQLAYGAEQRQKNGSRTPPSNLVPPRFPIQGLFGSYLADNGMGSRGMGPSPGLGTGTPIPRYEDDSFEMRTQDPLILLLQQLLQRRFGG